MSERLSFWLAFIAYGFIPVKFASFVLSLIFLLAPFHAVAKDYSDFVSMGAGAFDFDKNDDRRESGDYRLEYEWGTSLLLDMSKSFRALDHYIQIHPTLGIEGNTKGSLYGNSGLNLDVLIFRHGIFTWGEALGAYSHGDDTRSLGSPLEFRSQVELGWRFDNNMRLTAYISHISNAGLSSENPGAEIVGAYLHIPLSKMAAK